MEPAATPPKANPSDKRRRLARRTLVIAGVVFLAYGVIGGLIAPPIAKRVIASNLGEKLGRAVEIDGLSVNPYTLNATLTGFRVMEADKRTPFVSFDRLDLDASITSVSRMAPVADEVSVDGLKVRLVRDGDNHYNLSDIITRLAAQPKAKDAEPARFSLANIRLAGARIDFDDRVKGAKHAVTDIDLAIPFISNLPRNLKTFVQPRLSANVNGTPLRISGETMPFENTLRTNVAVQLDGIDLPRYVGYSPTPLPVKLDAGKLDGRIAVRFSEPGGKGPVIDLSGHLALRELAVSNADGELARAGGVEADVASFDPLGGKGRIGAVRVTDLQVGADKWRVASIEARDIAADLGARDVRIDSLATHGGAIDLKRRADGSIEMPLRLPQDSASAPEAAQPASPWRVDVAKATIDDYRVTLADASLKPAATHRVAIAHVEATGLSTEKGSKSAVNGRLALDKGTVELDSTVTLDPLVVEAKVDARRIDLVAFRPYVQYFQTVKVKSAFASAKGNVQLRGAGKGFKVAYAGSAEVAKLASVDTVSGEDLLNWESVRAAGIAFRTGPDDPVEIAVGDIVVDKVYSRVVVTPEGKINLQQLKLATGNDPAPAPEPKENLKPRNVRIDRITFADSRLNFTDHFIKPNYTADVGELNGTVTGLSSDPASRGAVDLKGSYDKSSPVVITGTINPLSGDLFLDIGARGKDIELPRLSAYSIRYAGYGITKGKLTLDVKYHVEGGKLDGRNRILLEQLTFGEKVESPEATKLPVLFAVNLLKDSQGRIDLELPIKGSLADPQFDMGALIAQVVGSLFKRAVTSPFSLLTAALGGDGGAGKADGGSDDLAFVTFDAGAAEGKEAERAKLDRISKALLDRPGIRIEMAPHVDEQKDMAALKAAALRARLSEAKGSPVTDEDYPRFLKMAYDKEFPAKAAPRDAKAEAPKADAPKEPTTAEMQARLLERVTVGSEALAALAASRASWVKGYLTQQGKLPADRVALAAADAATAGPHQSRVDFTLR